jgi:ABC-type Zn uptake system ZnuABC Zn-binding protein ZnuA
MSSRIRTLFVSTLAALTLATPAFAQLKVVTTTEDLASIARDIGARKAAGRSRGQTAGGV